MRERLDQFARKDFMPKNSNKSMLILIAGPYRSRRSDDPALMSVGGKQ